MQVALATFFFGLLATNTVFADTTGGQFVDKDNRKYYVKDDHKANLSLKNDLGQSNSLRV